jgi:hypothetical protein
MTAIIQPSRLAQAQIWSRSQGTTAGCGIKSRRLMKQNQTTEIGQNCRRIKKSVVELGIASEMI